MNQNAETCETCKKDPDLAWVTQAAAAGLTQLAETLRSGIPSEERSITRVSKSDFMLSAAIGLGIVADHGFV